MKNIDSYISGLWNRTNKSDIIVEENLWDLCRTLEDNGFLIGDDASISAISIGPFKIASTVDVKKKDMLLYFLETVIPAIFSKVNGLPFEQVYSLYLLPAANILISLANHSFLIKDLLQWEILLFIKKENKNDIYPTVDAVMKADIFKGIESWQISGAIEALKDLANILGDKHRLIAIDYEGRMECLV